MTAKPPTRAELVEQAIRRATGNARDAVRLRSGDENILRARQRMAEQQGRVLAPPSHSAGLDPTLSRIIWPDERNRDGTPMALGSKNPEMALYGYDHASQTSKLAVVLARHLGLAGDDLRIVEGIGLYHDLGRSKPWQYDDEHAQLSAVRADEAMRTDPKLWSSAVVREEVCRLIAQHSLRKEPPSDKRLIALWDAECFESVRFRIADDTSRDAVVVRNKRLKMCITAWAQDAKNQEAWEIHRRRQ